MSMSVSRAAILFHHSVDLIDSAITGEDLTASRDTLQDAMFALLDLVRMGNVYLKGLDTEIAQSG